jgi:ABC-2 type transport system ATP-binding protein
MIRLIDLTKVYRGLRAVDGINIEVRQGVIFGFLGPNGAGKSTTLRMMAGVIKPTSGRILINGMDLAEKPSAVKRCVGFIPDRPFLYEKLTASEFLRFVAGLYRTDDLSSLEHHTSELLGLFELEDRRNELIEGYSHGMKQRLVMCTSLLHRPKVLIVDEPMVGLDPKGAQLVKDVFKGQVDKGTTIFMSTHSLEVAEEMCEEIAIIQTGRIIATGSTASLKRQAGINGNLEQVFLKLTE